ncbi:MAG TPA: hypothetical protein VFS60_11325 [Thermoanaerobaculia bacterium]|nr:hypothetical protein [Thermoanaerobaculia bacterium]
MSPIAARSCAPAFLALTVALAATPLVASSHAPERSFAGGSAVELRGLPVSAATTANLGLVNLTPAGNRCSLALVGEDGTSLLPSITMTLRSFEGRPLLDVFEGLEALAGSEATAAISCDSAFSAFAVLADGDGETTRTIAAEKAAPALAVRAFLPLANKALACSAGATCFDAEGVVHEPGPPPGPPLPVGRVVFPAPAGTARRLVLSMDVKVGPWFPQETSGKHLIYWFVVNKNPDMPGLLYFRGPGKNEAFARHGMQVPHARKIKVIKKWAAEVGRTYHIVNDYDMAGNRYTVTISDAQTGEVQVVLTSRPNVSSYVVKAGSKFLIDMGFYPGKVPTEVPSYGWRYSNVHVEVFR